MNANLQRICNLVVDTYDDRSRMKYPQDLVRLTSESASRHNNVTDGTFLLNTFRFLIHHEIGPVQTACYGDCGVTLLAAVAINMRW